MTFQFILAFRAQSTVDHRNNKTAYPVMRSAFLACRIKLFLSILVCWGGGAIFSGSSTAPKKLTERGGDRGDTVSKSHLSSRPLRPSSSSVRCWLVGEAALGIYSLVTLHCLVAVFPFLVFSFFHTPGPREQDWMV